MKYRFKLSGHFKDVLNIFSGTIIYAISSVVSNVVLGRNLAKDDFGKLNAINSTVSLIALFVLFGLNITSVRLISKLKKNNPLYISSAVNRLKIFYKKSLAFFIVVYLISIPFLTKYIFNDLTIILTFYLSVAYLFSFSYSDLISGILTGLGEFDCIRKINILRAITTTLIFLSTYYISNLNLFYIIFVLNNLVLVFISNIWLKKILVNKYELSKNELSSKFNKKLISYSIYILLGGVVVLPFIYVSNLILSQGKGIYIFGILSVFSTWQGVLTFFPVTYSKVVLPFISGNKTQLSRNNNFLLTTKINIYSVFFIYFILMLLSEYILSLYGKNFSSYILIFNLFLGSTAIAFLGNTYGAQVQVRGFRYTIVFGNLIVGIAILALTYFTHTKLGILSLCLGMLLGNCLNFLVSFITIILKDNFPLKIHYRVITSYIIMMALIFVNYNYLQYFNYFIVLSLLLMFMIDRLLKILYK